MGRICGLCGQAADGIDEAALRRFSVDCHRNLAPDLPVTLHSGPGVRLATQGEGTCVRDDDGFVCCVDGRFTYDGDTAIAMRNRGIDLAACTPAQVLLHYYRFEGPAALKWLRGSFVFAIWDTQRQRLILGRDPSGVKRIYYTQIGSGFAFASDLTGLARFPSVSRIIGEQGALEYFSFGYVCPPHTIYRDIALLLPGQYCTFQDGTVQSDSFWELPLPWQFADVDGRSEEALVDELDRLVTDAVVCRVGDSRHVALYLSGGLDTSLLAAVTKRHLSARVTAFTFSSNDPACDEMPNAQGIAQHVGIEEHCCCRPDPAEYLATLSLIPGIFGQPIADTSVLANYTVTRRVAQDFTWVVGGDGPDGLYGNWDLRPWFWYYRLTPAWLRHPCADLAILADRLLRLHLSTPSRHVQELLSQPEFSWVYHKKLKSGELERVLGRPVAADQFPVARFLKDRLDIPLYERLRIALSRFFVVDGVLQKTCGVHEAFGVDQVCPYYDRRLADFIQFLPSRYKIRGIGFGKYLHQQLLRRYLPDRLWLHRKMGFTMNLNELGLDAVRGLSDRYLSPSRVSETGLLNAGAVDDCVRGYFAGDARMGPLVYTFLVFEMWREQFA